MGRTALGGWGAPQQNLNDEWVEVEPMGRSRWGVVLLLGAAVVMLAAAPLFLDNSYSVVEHSTSESAGQMVTGSWAARAGFVLFALATLWLSRLRARRWGAWGSALHGGFGVSMLATAVYASRPWLEDLPFDETEDVLHSIASFGVGLCFTIGVLLVGMRVGRRLGRPRWFDVVAFVLAPGISLAMTALPDVEGLLQRFMFLIAFAWYGREALIDEEDDR